MIMCFKNLCKTRIKSYFMTVPMQLLIKILLDDGKLAFPDFPIFDYDESVNGMICAEFVMALMDRIRE